MPAYSIVLSRTAIRQLDRLPDNTARKIISTIQLLAENPRPAGIKKLKGRQGFRIRQGDYRIIYDIIDRQLIVEVIAIGHRKNIYE